MLLEKFQKGKSLILRKSFHHINAVSYKEAYFMGISCPHSLFNDLFISKIAGCLHFFPTWHYDVSFGIH